MGLSVGRETDLYLRLPKGLLQIVKGLPNETWSTMKVSPLKDHPVRKELGIRRRLREIRDCLQLKLKLNSCQAYSS